MVVFGLGMIIGLVTISRFLTWSLKKHKNVTFAILTGFMIGALNKLWAWRVPVKVMDENDNIVAYTKGMEYDKVITEFSTTPSEYLAQTGNPSFILGVIVFFLIGMFLVLGMDYFSSKKSK